MHIKKRYYILTAVFSYLFFLLSGVPASKIVSLADQNKLIPAKLYGVQGSLWNGSAEKIIIPNQLPIDNLKWSLSPASLLMAKLSSEINGNIKNQNFIGNVSVNAFGTVEASDIRARVDSSTMQELIQMPFGELGGVFNLNVESIILDGSPLPKTSASLKWKSAKLTLAETVDLGHINISIKPGDENQLIATIANTQGQLSINGTASVDNNKLYALDLRIKPAANVSSDITQSLTMFSKRQKNGDYLVKRKGNLRELGL